MWLKWLPWRSLVRRAARARGFVDPISVLSHLHRFAQPAEVGVPIELLRAGVVFHTRGLMNSAVIQHNLDWIWPYWVERQFDPHDPSFIPRAFSITHVNLTHRNWTAVGCPELDWLPIVDPRGLVTPFWDGWSLDAWIVDDEGHWLIPSKLADVRQQLCLGDGLAVATQAAAEGMSLVRRVEVRPHDDAPLLVEQLTAALRPRRLVVALRPYNPEGVSFVHDVALDEDHRGWTVDGRRRVQFSAPAERHDFSEYRRGDVALRLPLGDARGQITCDVGMVTAAALFRLAPGEARELEVSVPRSRPGEAERDSFHLDAKPWMHTSWRKALSGQCRLSVPDAEVQFLYDAALRTLVLHTPGDVYPGPYTYKRFWFRDAAFILNALLCAGLAERVEPVLDRFHERQTRAGYFLSQEGEWDSNGEALWILKQWSDFTGRPPKDAWRQSVARGARWICRKRLSDDSDELHSGLMPAGFSAEHLGPNDYYYWDDFWSVAGLRAAAAMCDAWRDVAQAGQWRREADVLSAAIERSLRLSATHRDQPGIAASPHRRLDAGAIGSIVASYPLQVWPADEPRLLETIDFLIDHCFFEGGFFQDMIHSGINAYLSLHVAQVLLRAGDPHYRAIVDAVARLASPTGQWPEAIHPRTLGGCMGDGQHVWAAAEWLMIVRNAFVREEGERLILGSGIFPRWLESEQPLSFGPAPTAFGPLRIELVHEADRLVVRWQAEWFGAVPAVVVMLPGFPPTTLQPDQHEIAFEHAATSFSRAP